MSLTGYVNFLKVKQKFHKACPSAGLLGLVPNSRPQQHCVAYTQNIPVSKC